MIGLINQPQIILFTKKVGTLLLSERSISPHATPSVPFVEMKPEDIEVIIREALTRYAKGKKEHGDLDLDTDKTDFFREAEKELLDCINYCVF